MHLSFTRSIVFITAAACALGTVGCGGSGQDPSPVSPAPNYKFVDLGATDAANTQSQAFDVNNLGHVIGNFTPTAGSSLTKGFLYKDKVRSVLASTFAPLARLNDQDQYFDSAGLFHTGGTTVDIQNAYSLNGHKFHPYAINNNGAFSGSLDLSVGADDPSAHAATVVNGVVKDLGVLPGTFVSSGGFINDSGQVAGFSGSFPLGVTTGHAVLFSGGKIVDLGVLPGDTTSNSSGINNNGQVIGFSWNGTPNSTRYFLYSKGKITEIPLYPVDINDNGDIIGGAKANIDSDPCIYHLGVLYHLSARTQLPTGWILTSATGINNKGQISGIGTFGGRPRAFLLDPS